MPSKTRRWSPQRLPGPETAPVSPRGGGGRGAQAPLIIQYHPRRLQGTRRRPEVIHTVIVSGAIVVKGFPLENKIQDRIFERVGEM